MVVGKRVARKAVTAVIILILVIAAEFALFQVGVVDCPGWTYTQCWLSQYTPPVPPKCPANVCIALIQIRSSILRAYGFNMTTGEWAPLALRLVDYYHLMLVFNFGYNVGGLQFGPVTESLSQELPFMLALFLPAIAVAVALGARFRAVSRAGGGRPKRLLPVSCFLLLDVGLATSVGWGMSSGTIPSSSTPFGFGAVPPPGGLAYYGAAVAALALPLLALTLVTAGSLFLIRYASKGPLHFTTAISVSLLAALVWGVVMETAFGWPGIGWALAARTYDFPLDQGSVFVLSLLALATIFVLEVAKDVRGRRGSADASTAVTPLDEVNSASFIVDSQA